MLVSPEIDPRYNVETATRALQLLKTVATVDSPISLGALVEALGWSKPAVYRMVRTLEANGTLEQTGSGYVVGPALIPLGQAALRATRLPATARPYMERLHRRLDQTVVLTMLDYDEIVYLDRIEGEQLLIPRSNMGRRVPAYCTATGHALLSGLSDEEVVKRMSGHEFKRYAPKTLQTMDELLAKLAEVRRRGYSLIDEEFAVGHRSVAAPVRDQTGRVLGAVSISVMAEHVSVDQLNYFATAGLLPTVDGISSALGAPQQFSTSEN
jgi:IclR family transcriptional regulator, pca regulon regulatory protein